MRSRSKRAVMALAAVVGVGLLLPDGAWAQRGERNTLTVDGRGEASARPDQAGIHIGVVTQAETAAEALKQNSQSVEKLFAALEEFEIPQEKIQTANFNVSPQYARPERGREQVEPRITGYRVENTVRVEVSDLDRLGALLDTVVQRGANQIHSIEFEVSNREAVLDEARKAAIQNARRRAKLYAEAAGVTLGDVLTIDAAETETPGPPRPLMRAERAAASAPIARGEQEFETTVTVTYAIEK